MKKSLLIVLAIVLATLTACTAGGGAGGALNDMYHETTPEEVLELLDNGEDITLVDVRRGDEYEEAHIPGAILLPNEDIVKAKPDELPNEDATIIIYCRTGRRSKEAALKLIELGYTNVYDMGGINNWPYDTVSGTETGEWNATAKTGTEENEATDTNEATGVLSGFDTVDININSVNEYIFEDYDLTMVNVWATFCGPCINEMPDLGELAHEYKDKGFQIVGMVTDVQNSDGTINQSALETAKEIVSSTGADYLHIIPSDSIYYGLLEDMMYVPTTIFVDSKGNQVGEEYIGSRSKEEWIEIIDQMLLEASK